MEPQGHSHAGSSGELAGSWTSLQFSKVDTVIPPDAHPNTQWADGSFTPTGYFMGESGGCFYIVRRCQLEVPKAWDITVYQIPSTHPKLQGSVRAIRAPFRPNAVAVDPQQDIVAVVQSECNSFGRIYTYRLSTGENVDEPFVWETTFEFQTIVGNIEIKGDVIGLWTRQGVTALGSMEELRSKIQLRFFHLRTRAVIHVPTEGHEVWGFQFLDERKVLVSLTSKVKRSSHREKLKHRLRVLSLKISPEFKVNPDPRLNYYISLPTVKTPIIQRVLLVRNISPTENVHATAPDNPDHRLIGFRYQYTDVGYQKKDIIVLVNFQELLTHRENAIFLKMKPEQVTGQHFMLSGRRLVWSNGTSSSGSIHIRDYNPATAKACAKRLEGGTQTFSNPKNRSWQTKMMSLSSNPSKGQKSVHTECMPRSGIRNIFITPDSLVVVTDGRFLEDPRDSPVMLYIYTF